MKDPTQLQSLLSSIDIVKIHMSFLAGGSPNWSHTTCIHKIVELLEGHASQRCEAAWWLSTKALNTKFLSTNVLDTLHFQIQVLVRGVQKYHKWYMLGCLWHAKEHGRLLHFWRGWGASTFVKLPQDTGATSALLQHTSPKQLGIVGSSKESMAVAPLNPWTYGGNWQVMRCPLQKLTGVRECHQTMKWHQQQNANFMRRK